MPYTSQVLENPATTKLLIFPGPCQRTSDLSENLFKYPLIHSEYIYVPVYTPSMPGEESAWSHCSGLLLRSIS